MKPEKSYSPKNSLFRNLFPMICQQFAQLFIPETSFPIPGKFKLYLFQSSFSTQR